MKLWPVLRHDLARPAARHTFDSPPRPIDMVIRDMMGTGASPRVSRTEALSVPTVQRGRNLICSISTLPLAQRGPDNVLMRNPLLEQIDPDVANVVTLAMTVEDLLFEGIAWWRIVAFGFDTFPTSARRLDPATVSLTPTGKGSPSPLPGGHDPHGAVVYVDGKPVPAREMIRFDSPNPAVLKVGGRAIKRALLLDQLARMYADDPRPLDYFTPADGVDPVDDDEIAEILGTWRAARKARSTGYVPAALTYNTVDAPSPADLQLVGLQKQAGLDIANAFGVDPEDLGISTTSRTYANAVDRRRDRINDVLSPYMRAITDRLSMGDVTKRGYRVEFNLDDFLKANPTERWGVYEKALDLKVMTVEEVRAVEGLPAMAESVPDPVSQAAAAVAGVTFDEEPLRFADVPVQEFSVDTGARTIEGLAAPYGKLGAKYGLKFRFERGALSWSDPGRVKLLRDHDRTQPLGRAVALTDGPAGLRVKFSVARGAEGDRALELAQDGVLDGLSVGVDFDMATDAVPDPKNKGALLVRRADLREVSLTAMPSFDDARVTKVAASRDGKDTGMPDQDESATQTPPEPAGLTLTTPPGLTLSSDQLTALLGQPNGATVLATMLGISPAGAPKPEAEQRQTVNPTRLAASVTEAEPYTFDRDGNLQRGTHDFSTDLYAALTEHDQAAYDRALSFVQAQFDVVTTNVATLNPNTQRPDMYIDQRTFRYPIWEAIKKGTLTDKTPFVFPKFSSASGLVGAHTEGTEPSSGAFVATSQTITPTAISGKAKISREVWDAGGSPQVSNLIWNQMVKGWYEALEAAAVAELDAATPTSLATFTVGGGTNKQTLVAELEAALAALQFVRGGFSMTDLFAQIDLYLALVAAKDTSLRPYFPAIGPTNTRGTTTARFGALDINGITAYPAWALAATGIVAASSYLFDRDSVHGWASAPQRLDITMTEVANVYIGIWGYKATAISDINGVREIIYDPA